MTQDELKLVLDALKWCHGGEPCGTAEAIAVVEKALAQPEQEPVAWPRTMERGALVQWLHFEMVQHTLDEGTIDKLIEDAQAIPATPPQRKPLTDEQIDEEFKLYASKFDTSSDKWLDMGADDYFKAGFKAAHGIKE